MTHFSSRKNQAFVKLRCPRLFRKLGMPHADIFVLTGADWKKSFDTNHRKLRACLERLGGKDLMVRCDLAADSESDRLFLPVSQPMNSEETIAFLDRTAEQLLATGLRVQALAFLVSSLISPKASALVHAYPSSSYVRIDALWGFPDGLQYLPHDSYLYYSSEDRLVERRSYKGAALFFGSEASWKPEVLGPPFDWAHVLNRSEIQVLSGWARELATELDHEVQLMAFTRVGNHRGPLGCLPWHFTTLEVPAYESLRDRLPVRGHLAFVEDESGLKKLMKARESTRGIRLRPSEELARSKDFLRRCAQAATELGLPIFFEGSILGHAYYLLSSQGGTVVPIAPTDSESHPTTHRKLVRDKIPAIIRKRGGLARLRPVHQREAAELLKRKLVEEALEAARSPNESLPEELADVLEAIDALRSQIGLSKQSLARYQKKKREEKGGFESLQFLEESDYLSLHRPKTESEPALWEEDELTGLHSDALRRPVDLGTSDSTGFTIRVPLALPGLSGSVSRVNSPYGPITVTYSSDAVEIHLSRKAPAPQTEQYSLFPEPSEGEVVPSE